MLPFNDSLDLPVLEALILYGAWSGILCLLHLISHMATAYESTSASHSYLVQLLECHRPTLSPRASLVAFLSNHEASLCSQGNPGPILIQPTSSIYNPRPFYSLDSVWEGENQEPKKRIQRAHIYPGCLAALGPREPSF